MTRRAGACHTCLGLMALGLLAFCGDLGAQVFPDYRVAVSDAGAVNVWVHDQSGEFINLLDDDASRPSYFRLYVDGHLQDVLVDNRNFLGGAVLQALRTFRSSDLALELVADDGQAGSLPLALVLANETARPLRVRLELLLNTWLGETGQGHFHYWTPEENRPVDREAAFLAAPAGGVLVSGDQSGPAARPLRFLLPTGKPQSSLVLPDSFVVASYSRLRAEAGSYRPETGRDFSNLPFSVDDSAVLAVWPDMVLQPGQRQACGILLAWDQATDARPVTGVDLGRLEGLVTGQADKPGDRTPGTGQVRPGMGTAVDELNRLVEQLNRMLSGGTFDQYELERILQRIQELADRQKVD